MAAVTLQYAARSQPPPPASPSSADAWVVRLGGLAASVGSLVAGIGNLLHPETPLGDPQGVARAIAESPTWVAVHLAIVLGIVLMLGGLVALARSVASGLAGALAHFGLFAALVGGAVGLVLLILDGVAARQLAEEWLATTSPNEAAIALGLVHANETLNFALASLFNLLFAGVTFILFGLAVALSGIYPRWLGVVVVVGGVESMVAGVIQATIGEPTLASRVLTIIGPSVLTLWLFVMGMLMIRTPAARSAA
jgi:hypothetical protein